MTNVDDALIDSFKCKDEERVHELEAKIEKLEAKLRRRPVPKDDGARGIAKILDCNSDEVESEVKDFFMLRELREKVIEEAGNLDVEERDPGTIVDRVKSLKWHEEALEGLGENIKYTDHDDLFEKLTEIVDSHSESEELLNTVKDLHEFIGKNIPRGEVRFEDSTLDVLFERFLSASKKIYG